MYVEPSHNGEAQEILDRLVALHAHLRVKAGLPAPEQLSLIDRMRDMTDGFKSIFEIETIANHARQHVRNVRPPLGSPSNGDEVLAERFARDVVKFLERLQSYYGDVI